MRSTPASGRCSRSRPSPRSANRDRAAQAGVQGSRLGSPFHEHGLVADALIASGDEETLAILDEATELGGEAHEAFVKEAEEIGSNGFVVLNLVTAYSMRRAGEPVKLRRSGRGAAAK